MLSIVHDKMSTVAGKLETTLAIEFLEKGVDVRLFDAYSQGL